MVEPKSKVKRNRIGVRHILIVDDDAQVLNLFKQVLAVVYKL